jgi:meiotically up-regulated gene 157 (Mug157) protein
MMAVVALGELSEIEKNVYHDDLRADQARTMRQEVDDGIQKYGVVNDKKYGKIYAFEVDGLGHTNLRDDANVPSLLSAPYLGYLPKSDPIYQNTRALLLSPDNPDYAVGKYAKGIGSVHTPKGYIWPLSLIMQGFTSTSADERKTVIKELLASDPGDGLLHESFDPNDPKKLTRQDFGWPNALLPELVMVDNGSQKLLPVPAPLR